VIPGGSLTLAKAEPGIVHEVVLNSGVPQPMDHLLAPLNGQHMLTLLARDAVGNVSVPRVYRIVVDGEAPEVSLTFAPATIEDEQNNLWLPLNSSAKVIALDALSGLKTIQWEDATRPAESQVSPLTVALDQEGKRQLVFRAEDQLGNIREKTQIVNVDGTAPTGEIQPQGPQENNQGRLILGPGATLSAQLSDKGSGLARWTAELDGEEVDPESWGAPWSKGSHVAQALAWDRVGNHAVAATPEFIYDPVAPMFAIKLQGDYLEASDGVRYYKDIAISATARDDVFGARDVSWQDSQGLFQQMTSELHPSGTSLLVRSLDAVGNQRDFLIEWQKDDTPSQVTLFDAAGRSFPSGKPLTVPMGQHLFLKHEDSQVGPGLGSYGFNRKHLMPLAGNIRFDRRGTFHLIVIAADRLGNSAEYIWPITVTP